MTTPPDHGKRRKTRAEPPGQVPIIAVYKVHVTTGGMCLAGTNDHVFVTLVGTNGESERTELDNYGLDFCSDQTSTYTVNTQPLGHLLLIKLEKAQYLFLPENQWFCSKIVVDTPEGEALLFPCHRWLTRGEVLELRGAKAMKASDDYHPLLIEHRRRELAKRSQLYQWKVYADRTTHITHFEESELPSEVRFSFSKGLEFTFSKEFAIAEVKLKGLFGSEESWESLESMKNTLTFKTSSTAEYLAEHWKDDAFYGYQFLNGVHPSMIRNCPHLPSNFPVTEEMVQPFLETGTSLKQEIQKGNIFLCDYKSLEGLPTRVVEGNSLPLTAALCLLYLDTAGTLKPIAIQLGQEPSEKCPIFVPSDPELDWLLVKIFVKNADSVIHQVISHLMKTHLLAEVFAVATMRHFPDVHPLYKLLTPHFRYTLQINAAARRALLGPTGLLARSTPGLEGIIELLRRHLAETTYSSLCLPDNIAERGLQNIPNFYYRDDGLKLWTAINRFVRAMLGLYYPTDDEVSGDAELQRWIQDIFTKGFLGNSSSGMPESFITVEAVVKFVTMVIFTTSAQHAAVNSGQFDYYSWFPNSPLQLRKAPPTTKGLVTMDTILETLPNIGDTVAFIISSLVLYKKYMDSVVLGSYPEERFCEPAAKRIIENFQKELSSIEERIITRNASLDVPYCYLQPSEIENSVSI
ncbi:hydroperoxide isomerase ALOXE3-like [Gadus macrocephalus]|uniref:hydroperoxide isomerase ALOXE3-like n=1 Tax=Gadus macrocephalus TaxID=80720 RepID=UPI0028CB1E5C|nr:hydroperoxide isomerase ALOXE3-like [Gadus macrocephalus]